MNGDSEIGDSEIIGENYLGCPINEYGCEVKKDPEGCGGNFYDCRVLSKEDKGEIVGQLKVVMGEENIPVDFKGIKIGNYEFGIRKRGPVPRKNPVDIEKEFYKLLRNKLQGYTGLVRAETE